MPASLLAAAARAPKQASALKPVIVGAVAQMSGSLTMDAATTTAVRALLSDPATTAATLPIVARWDSSGALKAEAEARAGALARQLADVSASGRGRAEIAAGLMAIPTQRAATLPSVEGMLAAAHIVRCRSRPADGDPRQRAGR